MIAQAALGLLWLMSMVYLITLNSRDTVELQPELKLFY